MIGQPLLCYSSRTGSQTEVEGRGAMKVIGSRRTGWVRERERAWSAMDALGRG